MNNAARHEAAHALAVHLLGLADILRPGGAAITSNGVGGVTALSCDTMPSPSGLIRLADRLCNGTEPCEPAVTAAREHPALVPELLTFIMAGYGATVQEWRGDFGETIIARTSSDFATARAIILDLLGSDNWPAQSFASESAFDALERAATWAKQSHVKEQIDRGAAHLEEHGAATWTQLQTLFAHIDNGIPGRISAPPCASGDGLLIDAPPEVAGGACDPLATEIQNAKPNEKTKGMEV